MVTRRMVWGLLGWLWLIPAVASVPEPISWERLRDVQFKKKWYPEENVVMLYPQFGPTVKALKGKAVTITGYVIPVDVASGLYVVSRFPMSACFFCGAAGPESIIALNFRQLPRKFRTDERQTFTGKFRLNSENIYELNYILENAELTSGKP